MKTALMVNGNHVTEEYITERMAHYNLPDHMTNGLFLYLAHRIPPGSFMTAMLSNNFSESVARADIQNAARLKEWAQFLYCEMPSGSHGSPENVKNWLQEREIES
jgi:hypothetical protein